LKFTLRVYKDFFTQELIGGQIFENWMNFPAGLAGNQGNNLATVNVLLMQLHVCPIVHRLRLELDFFQYAYSSEMFCGDNGDNYPDSD
jgi:hypothetical protein